MPRPGGEADKLGNDYEALWAVDAALDLIDDDYVDLTVEPVGDEDSGVEFVLTDRSGGREYHSIKRQQGDGNWTLARLTQPSSTGRSILGDLIAKTGPESRAVFSSGTSASDLEELIRRARASDSYEQFEKNIGGSGRRSWQFRDLVDRISGDERAVWTALQRLCIRTENESRLINDVERRVHSMFRMSSGQPVDAQVIRLLIRDFLSARLGVRIDASDLLDALDERGVLPSRLAGDASVGQQIRRVNRAYLKELRALLINGEKIIREEAAAALSALLDDHKSVMLQGAAGSGKSCVLAQLIEHLEEQGVPCLVMRLDRLDSGDQHAQAIGIRLGLSKSPAITLGEFAGGQPSVLVVDQLDAIGVVSARNQATWGAFNELLDEARTYPNMRILFACRSFDLERDPRLRALADDRERVERIPVGPLDEEVIRSAIVAAGLDPTSLNQTQIEILSTPLHLHLLLESANPGPMRFASARDLFDAFWRHKAAAVSRQMGGRSGVWAAAVGRLCDELSEQETLVAPSYVLDDYGEALGVLASEGVVYVQDDSVRLFHESFFDYAFARAFVRSNKDLVQWLLDDEQHLFRRSQVRQVLEFLRNRESDRGRYLKTLRDLLSHPEVRFHIKKLVIEWLGAPPDPIAAEWHIIEGLEDELGEHLWGVARNSVPWFDTLCAMGRWESWLEADDEQARRALWLLQSPTVLKARSATIAKLLGRFRGASDEWRERLRWWGWVRYGNTTEQMRDLVISLIADGTLDDTQPGVGGNRDWWSNWYGLGSEQPEFLVQALGAWFDRQLARAAEVGRDDPFRGEPARVGYSQRGRDLVQESATAAPLAFVHELFPRLAEFDAAVPMNYLRAPSRYAGMDEQLREGLAIAMMLVAQEDPRALDAVVDVGTQSQSRWMPALLLRAWSANPGFYAERIVRFLLESPDDRLDIGYGSWSGEVDALAAISRTAVAAASGGCSDASFAELEDAILRLSPEWEQSLRRVGRTALTLLRALPEKRISERARRRVRELERRYPNAPERGAPRPPDEDSSPVLVGPPIDSGAQRLMTDDQWLGAMARYGSEREWPRANLAVGGAIELSRGLQALVAEDPDRFSRLTTRMDASLNPVYFEAILDGLTRHEGSTRPGTLEQVCVVLRRIADTGVQVRGQTIAGAIGTLSGEPLPEDIVDMLIGIAENDADPQEDRWAEGTFGDSSLAPINQAINSGRGAAAMSLAGLLFANRDRWDTVKGTVGQLVTDPVLAVRSVGVECLLAILDTHRGDALAGFARLLEAADPLLGTQYVERFVHYAMFRDYPALRPTLIRMLQSAEPAVVKIGARQMALAGLWIEEARSDTSLVLGMGDDARAGAAETYADYVSDETVGAECEEHLKSLFSDASEEARRAASRCWAVLEPDEVAKRGSLLGAFVQSMGRGGDAYLLLHGLEESHLPLPVEVCDMAERVVTAYDPGGDMADYVLAPLVIRLHEEANDQEFRHRVLDLIDDMLRVGFMGMSGGLREQYDR